MSMIDIATSLRQTAASRQHISSIFRYFRDAFQERRRRQQLRAALLSLSDKELMDIGTTRGEVDYVASHRDIDPRGACTHV